MQSSRKTYETIDEYIASFSEDVRDILEKLRQIIKESAPDAKETMVYGIPTFRLKCNLVHFAAFKNHIGFYPTPSAIEAFKEELAPYKQSKGTIQFPLNKPIPFDLVKRIVRFRIEQNQSKKK
jgi:uncharacterized protein YdhG (YjbR/CyaY superfamily)